MRPSDLKTKRHVCPRNCPSTCTLFSHSEKDRVVHISGDKNHPYTDGKLCAKGFSYVEQNRHADRLKYPYYQKIKGSGNFERISWENAYKLIVNEMKKMKENDDSFLPLAWYKGSGNIGVHHYVTDDFFSKLGKTTKIIGGTPKINEELYPNSLKLRQYNPHEIVDSSIVIIWGANPAFTNIHLIPFLIDAKVRGAKIVVIDPIYTRTAELADVFIQLRPNTDETFAKLLTKKIFESESFKAEDKKENRKDFDAYRESIINLDDEESLQFCDVRKEAYQLLLHWFSRASGVSYILGAGIQKHLNGKKAVQAIESLAAIQKTNKDQKINVFFKNHDMKLFNNQRGSHSNDVQISDLSDRAWAQGTPVNMLWFTCGNPLLQEANPNALRNFMESVPFVVTIDHFMTQTAKMSNLILPTTTFFEEMDVVMSPWYGEIFFNEKGVSPYFESKSEWEIMTNIAKLLKDQTIGGEEFPIHSSEEEYLNAQFNEDVYDRYSIRSIQDLKERIKGNLFLKPFWESREENNSEEDYVFHHNKGEDELESLELIEDHMTSEYPFWFLTPHHPYKLNSQFHFLNLSEEKETYLEANPQIAKEYDIDDGEFVRVYNDLSSIILKLTYNPKLPKDIVMVYPGWYPDSPIVINDLISHSLTENTSYTLQHTPFYNTFVNIEKF